MIKLHVIGSSSEGNSFIIQDGATTILLDVGFPAEKIRSKLFQLGLSAKDITGVLVTHEHQDHIMGINFLKGVPKFMTKGTFEAAQNTYKIDKREVTFIVPEVPFKVGSITALGMPTQHDAKEPVSFLVKNTSNEKIVFMTDTGIANNLVKNAEMYVIEANHSEELLRLKMLDGDLPEELYTRIANNHLSSEKSVTYLDKCMGDKTKQVILMHMSPRNSNPVGTMNYFRKMLDSSKIDFIHPKNHKFTKCWEIGYKPTRQRSF